MSKQRYSEAVKQINVWRCKAIDVSAKLGIYQHSLCE